MGAGLGALQAEGVGPAAQRRRRLLRRGDREHDERARRLQRPHDSGAGTPKVKLTTAGGRRPGRSSLARVVVVVPRGLARRRPRPRPRRPPATPRRPPGRRDPARRRPGRTGSRRSVDAGGAHRGHLLGQRGRRLVPAGQEAERARPGAGHHEVDRRRAPAMGATTSGQARERPQLPLDLRSVGPRPSAPPRLTQRPLRWATRGPRPRRHAAQHGCRRASSTPSRSPTRCSPACSTRHASPRAAATGRPGGSSSSRTRPPASRCATSTSAAGTSTSPWSRPDWCPGPRSPTARPRRRPSPTRRSSRPPAPPRPASPRPSIRRPPSCSCWPT